jgi:WD40 repeat protein
VVAYPSHSILNLATFDGAAGGSGSSNGGVPRVQTTLRTGTVPNPNLDPAAGDRIIAAISQVEAHCFPADAGADAADAAPADVLACAFSDGTVTVWHRDEDTTTTASSENDDGGNGWREIVIVGHEAGASSDEPSTLAPTSVADVAGIATTTTLAIVTASVDGIDLHIRPLHARVSPSSTSQTISTTTSTATASTQTIKVSSHAAASISVKILQRQNELLIVSGTASPRGNRVHVYTVPLDSLAVNQPPDASTDIVVRHQGSLPGHLDWVTCFAFCREGGSKNNDDDDGGFLLASGSHDARVRLWKFHPSTAAAVSSSSNAGKDHHIDDDSSDGSDDESEADEDDLLDEGEARLRIQHWDGTETAVTLEALLIGHEEAVTSLSFRPRASNVPMTSSTCPSPCLMSSSMDRSILLWMEESSEEDDAMVDGGAAAGGGAWVPISRVGAAGGILGGPIGSSLSGFVDAAFSPDGNGIAGHGYGGSLHFWSTSGRKYGDEVETERWSAGPCLTGHFRGVSDISWEVSQGQYLLSAGLDQTCRLWAEIPVASSSGVKATTGDDVTWHEAGRPQVHGFDLNALACVSNHRLLSGADEKVTRVFEAPKATLRLLQSLAVAKTGGATSSVGVEDKLDRPERAFLPSLGLSNRTTVTGGIEEEDGFEATGASTTSDPNNENQPGESQLKVRLPTERDLGVVSLWPESRKLFGHHYEVVCVAATTTPTGDVIVASACKARDVENASIMIFDVNSGRCLQVLKGGHRSTVVSLSFSADGQYLASAGKDRRLCLWEFLSQEKRGEDDQNIFYLASAVDSAHKRIIWSVDFCSDKPCLLATGARDGCAKIWEINATEEGTELKDIHK